MALDPIFIYANYAEACFWGGLSVLAMVKRNSRASWPLAGALLAFGVSDVVEVQTGAWYRPWWLLVWKTVCVVLIVVFGWMVLRVRQQRMAAERRNVLPQRTQ